MAMQQKIKVRIGIGPDTGAGIAPFQQPATFAAIATAALRALTADRLYSDAEFTGTKGGVTATVTVESLLLETAQLSPLVFRTELEGTVMLDSPDAPGH
jgi:hypothetical protein